MYQYCTVRQYDRTSTVGPTGTISWDLYDLYTKYLNTALFELLRKLYDRILYWKRSYQKLKNLLKLIINHIAASIQILVDRMSSSSDSIELAQVKVRSIAGKSDAIVFIPSKITKLSLCQCVSKITNQHVSKISLNSIPIEREMIILKDGDIIGALQQHDHDSRSSSSSSSSSSSDSPSDLITGAAAATHIEQLSPFRRKLAQENIVLKSDLDFIVLFIHFLMTTQSEWSCIVEDGQSSVKG